MASLLDIGKTVKDIHLGGVDAESDQDLGEYFVDAPYVNNALRANSAHILGRKGSGKSALFRQLPDLLERREPGTVVVLATPDQYAWGALRKYEELGFSSEAAHTNAWKYTLAVIAASELLSKHDHWPQEVWTHVKVLEKFLKDNYPDGKPTLSTVAMQLTSLDVSAFGLGLGFSRKKEREEELSPNLVTQLMSHLMPALEIYGVMIAIDRLDDHWDASAPANTLLIGLLKASKELTDMYGPSARKNTKGLRVFTFMRSDIYDLLDFHDKDKHRPLEEPISWDDDLLKEMVQLRLPDTVDVNELFDGKMRGSRDPFSYILNRTFLRPREVLQFLEECIRRSPGESTVIAKESIYDAEDTYSTWKVQDLKSEYRSTDPDLPRMLEAFRQGKHRYDTIDNVKHLLNSRVPDLVEKHGARNICEKLLDRSIIGVRLRDSGATKYKAAQNNLTLPDEAAVYIHPALRQGLLITEARKPSM